MKLNLPIFRMSKVTPTEKNQEVSTKKTEFKFEPIDVDLNSSNLSQRMKDLIYTGTGIDTKYSGNESSAFFAACIAMAGIKFTDQEIASVLTDKEYYLSGVSYRHAGNTRSRERAAKWTIEQNVKKARTELSKKSLFEETHEPQYLSEKKFKLEAFKDVNFDPNTNALVENLIGHGSLVLIYGDTNTGKTFATLDLAVHVAQGKIWQDRKVEQGAVLYVATEGGIGIRKRIAALKKAFALEKQKIPLWLVSSTISLSNPKADANSLIQEIKKTENENGVKINFLIIDTLNRAFAGGDENSSADMGAFLKCIDFIREATCSTVALVHHSGKDTGKGARGHSSLKAAVDTEIKIEADKKTKTLTASVTKQREYEYGPPMGFKLEQVEIAKSSDGKIITSCVLRPFSCIAANIFSEKSLNSIAKNAWDVLNTITDVSSTNVPKNFSWPKNSQMKDYNIWKSEFKSRFYKDKHRSTFHSAFLNARRELEKANRIEVRENYVRLLNAANNKSTEMSGSD